MPNLTSVTVTAGVPTAGTGTVSTIDGLIAAGLNVVVTNANSNGSKTSANSAPVVIASDQASIPVAATLSAETTKVIGTVNVAAAQNISLVPATSGGCTISSTLIASGTNATSVKASAGQLYKIEITNNSSNIAYLKIYNTAGTPTAGSGTPVIRLMVPGNASGTGAFTSYENGIAFATGIGFTFTGGIADADTTSVAASAFIVNLYYK